MKYDDVPNETQCFLCLKTIKKEDAGMFVIRFSNGNKGVLLCDEDYEWAEKNMSATHAMVKSRFIRRGII